ncbi:MAG: alpha-glucuronidase [Fibrobacter sp.]|nr:alpha-glucuronidase [Fibrobacter sp.]
MIYSRIPVITLFVLFNVIVSFAETGYDLWLRYVQIQNATLRTEYKSSAAQIVIQGTSSTMKAVGNELVLGLNGLLNQSTPNQTSVTADGAIIVGTPSNSTIIKGLNLNLENNPDAYKIVSATVDGHAIIAIASTGETGTLYGAFHLLRLIQTGQSITNLNISETPKIKRRLLNHWDNLNGTIERGYAGSSLWNWSKLPGTIDKRYTDYARACASIGINGTVLNNVNADANILNSTYLTKVKALADVFRPYGIKVYLSANFAAPQRIGGLSTADPLNSSVISWWKQKCNDIYKQIPDFGGFLVKANSEGQPGPKTYNRTHAEGANCLADALAPHGGVVIWRAFVYDDAIDSDRMKRAYKEFKPLDGKFRSNVIVQAKNGPFDFQPREPVHPLFGGLLSTHIGAELQITKEYLGQGIHLVYLAPMWKEVLDFDTYAKGPGSTVAKVLDGTVFNDTVSCIAGVANTGSNTNWCGHHFDQANWYAYGRLAWNYQLGSDEIADEWTKMTWGWDTKLVETIMKMLAGSHEACVNYMDPLGLGGIFKYDGHYGPEPGYNKDKTHLDWNSVYWHKADNIGVGYNRTTSGSDYVSQYYPENKNKYNNMSTCPPELLCWFFHVPWNQMLSTGKTFWNELCFRYYDGLHYVGVMDSVQWPSLSSLVDAQRFSEVKQKLATHYRDARAWRDTCTRYFAGFSKLPIPTYEPPVKIKPLPVITGDEPVVMNVFNLQGKLVKTIALKQGASVLNSRNILKKNIRNGIYVVCQDGVKPFKLVVGTNNRIQK